MTTTTIDTATAYQSAAARHTALCRELVAADEARTRARQSLTRTLAAGRDATAAQRRFDQGDAEVRRLQEAEAESNQVASEARAVCNGNPPERPRREPRPVPVVRAPLPELTELETALADGTVVTRVYHDATLTYAVEQVERQWAVTDRRLRRLLDLANADRVAQVVDDTKRVRHQNTAKHDADCWQRHAGCLADRVLSLLNGEDVDR